MPISISVLQQSIQRLGNVYGSEITEIAAMVYTTRLSMRHCASQHGANPEGLLARLDRCVESHLIDRDLDPTQLALAVAEFDRDMANAMEH